MLIGMKMKTTCKAIALVSLLLLLALPGAAQARTAYVSDELVITLRTGKGPEFKIVDYLVTGTPLEVLQEEDNYMQVRTPTDKEGWVLSRYITAEIPKERVIEKLEKELKNLRATMGNAENIALERDKLLEENKSLRSKNERLESEIRRTERREIMYWFLAGAGVLLVGWLIGKASRQKRFY